MYLTSWRRLAPSVTGPFQVQASIHHQLRHRSISVGHLLFLMWAAISGPGRGHSSSGCGDRTPLYPWFSVVR
jgi:hypothetical protein